MEKDLELTSAELVKLLLNNKSKLILPTLILVTATVFWILFSSNQYIAESIISLPDIVQNSDKVFDKSDINIPIDVQSAKYIIMNFGKKSIKDNSALSKYFVNVSAQEIKGSERFLKLSVKANGSNQKALEISNKIMDYLQSGEYVNEKISAQRLKNDREISDIREAIKASEIIERESRPSVKKSASLQYNPVDIQLGLIALKSQLHELEKTNNSLENYKYVESPIISIANKNVYMKVITSICLGLFMGFFWILLKEYLK